MPPAKRTTTKRSSTTAHKNGSPPKMPAAQKKIYDKLIRKGISEKRAISFSKNAARRIEVSEKRHKAAVASAQKGPPVRKTTSKGSTVRRSGKK